MDSSLIVCLSSSLQRRSTRFEVHGTKTTESNLNIFYCRCFLSPLFSLRVIHFLVSSKKKQKKIYRHLVHGNEIDKREHVMSGSRLRSSRNECRWDGRACLAGIVVPNNLRPSLISVSIIQFELCMLNINEDSIEWDVLRWRNRSRNGWWHREDSCSETPTTFISHTSCLSRCIRKRQFCGELLMRTWRWIVIAALSSCITSEEE